MNEKVDFIRELPLRSSRTTSEIRNGTIELVAKLHNHSRDEALEDELEVRVGDRTLLVRHTAFLINLDCHRNQVGTIGEYKVRDPFKQILFTN